MPAPSKVEVEAAFRTLGFVNDPATISKLLRAIASGELAISNQYDITLIAAANMIDRFSEVTKCLTGAHGKSRNGGH